MNALAKTQRSITAERENEEEYDTIAALYGQRAAHLQVGGWIPAAEAGFEVVVFVHGWSSALKTGVENAGQL